MTIPLLAYNFLVFLIKVDYDVIGAIILDLLKHSFE